MADITCRYCEHPVAVPASKCPWCGKQIMVICASCKTYTDDEKSHCDHCGEPLEPDRMEEIVIHVRHPELAKMVEDRKRSRLVASAVVLNSAAEFFYAREGFQTVLARLFGSVTDRAAAIAGVVFSAYAYVCRNEYCSTRLLVEQDRERVTLARLRPWDGQQSVEAVLAEHAARAMTTREATEKMIRGLMDFRIGASEGSVLASPGVRDAPQRAALAAVDQLARLTVLPEHDPAEARRTTYRLIAAFVDEDPDRAQALASETTQLLREFESRA